MINLKKKAIEWSLLLLSGVLAGYLMAGISARAHYHWGFSTAMNNQDQTCVAWWFNNSAVRINEAKHYACGKR